MDPRPSSIGERLRLARRTADIPQHVLAVRLGIAPSSLARWESDGSIKAHHLPAIASALGVSVEWIVTGEHRSDEEAVA